MRTSSLVLVAGSLLAVSALGAQPASPIARAVAAAPDGIVRMTYAARAGVCGDGDRHLSFGELFHAGRTSGFGRTAGARCATGPLRVSLAVRAGRPVSVRTAVGDWSSPGEARITDLGVVSARAAADYFLAAVPQLERESGSRTLLPVVLADSADPVSALLALARDGERTTDTRRQAIHWSALLGGEAAAASLRALVEDAGMPVAVRSHAIFALSLDGAADVDLAYLGGLLDRLHERKLREQVVFALSRRDEPAATDALIRVARHDRDREVRKKAWFWLGQMSDPRAERAIAEMVLR